MKAVSKYSVAQKIAKHSQLKRRLKAKFFLGSL